MAEWEPEDRNPNDGGLIKFHVLEDTGLKQSKIADLRELKKNPKSEFNLSWDFLETLTDKPLEFVEDLWNKWLSWETRQPKWFKNFINQVKTQTDLTKLQYLGQDVHEKKASWLNRDQAGVFWTEYHSQKHKLEPKHLGLTTRSFLKKIIQSNGHIGALGVFLHNVQSGKIKVTPDPTKHEWGVIWETYKRRKEVHATM